MTSPELQYRAGSERERLVELVSKRGERGEYGGKRRVYKIQKYFNKTFKPTEVERGQGYSKLGSSRVPFLCSAVKRPFLGFHVLDLYSQFTQMELSSQARARLQEAKVKVNIVHHNVWVAR